MFDYFVGLALKELMISEILQGGVEIQEDRPKLSHGKTQTSVCLLLTWNISLLAACYYFRHGCD